jgi:hypothetical protein
MIDTSPKGDFFMAKGKAGGFRGYQGKNGPPGASTPAGQRKPSPPPRVTVRPKPSSKGR